MAIFEVIGKDGKTYEIEAPDISTAASAMEEFHGTSQGSNESKTPKASGMMGFFKNLTDNPQVRAVAQGVPILGASVPDNEETFKFKQENPKTAKALKIGGGVASTIPLIAATGGLGLGAGLAADATMFGGLNAADAYARDEDPRQAALLGAILGPAGRLLGSGISKISGMGLKNGPKTVEKTITPELAPITPHPFPNTVAEAEAIAKAAIPEAAIGKGLGTGRPSAPLPRDALASLFKQGEDKLKATMWQTQGTPKEVAEAAWSVLTGKQLPTKQVEVPSMVGDSAIGGLAGAVGGHFAGIDPFHAAILGALTPHALKRAGTYGSAAINSNVGQSALNKLHDNATLNALLRTTIANSSNLYEGDR